MRSALSLAAVSLAAAVLLSGCVLQEPEVVPPPESTTEPVFASDEEALAAATDAYEEYLAMSDLIAQEGGKDPERIAPFVTEEWLEEELTGFELLRDSGRRINGSSSFTNVRIQQNQQEEDGRAYVVIYVCSDESEIQVVDARGDDVTPGEIAYPWPSE